MYHHARHAFVHTHQHRLRNSCQVSGQLYESMGSHCSLSQALTIDSMRKYSKTKASAPRATRQDRECASRAPYVTAAVARGRARPMLALRVDCSGRTRRTSINTLPATRDHIRRTHLPLPSHVTDAPLKYPPLHNCLSLCVIPFCAMSLQLLLMRKPLYSLNAREGPVN